MNCHFLSKSNETAIPQAKRLQAGLFLAVFLLCLFFENRTVPAFATETVKPKVIMIVVNRIAVEDIISGKYPNINTLVNRGGIGLMTINTGGDYADGNAYVSLGGGDKFVGSPFAGWSYNAEETVFDGSPASQAYRRNTGNNSGLSEVLNVGIASILKYNRKGFTVSTPGQLGNILHENGLKVAVMGHSDLNPAGEPNRLAVALGMDDTGRVDFGNVSGSLLKNDQASPYGWRTDYAKLKIELNRVLHRSDLIVIETGDTSRVNSYNDQLTKTMTDYHRSKALGEVDKFVETLLPEINADNLVMLVTPLPHIQAIRDGKRLSPVIMAGGTIVPGSVLTSPSIRQKGLVANYDLAATVALHLTAEHQKGIIGLALQSVKETDPKGYTAGLYKNLIENSQQRTGVLYYFTRLHWIVYILALFQIISGYRFKKELNRIMLMGILLYPIAILSASLIRFGNTWLTILVSLLLLAVITYILTRIKNDLKLYLTIAVVTGVPIVLDVLLGGTLMKKAALGYDLIVGGRNYGIGNEYMGVLLGAVLLGVSAVLGLKPELKKKLQLPIIALFALLALFFASPAAGTNAGGAIAAVVAFSVTTFLLLDKKINQRSAFLLLVALITGVSILIAVNHLFTPATPSHIGRAINNLVNGELAAIWFTIQRKLIANLYLVRNSPFSIILALQVVVWGTLMLKYGVRLRAVLSEKPSFQAGMAGMFFGAVAAFVFNDSGVIASALLLNYFTVPLTLMILDLDNSTGTTGG